MDWICAWLRYGVTRRYRPLFGGISLSLVLMLLVLFPPRFFVQHGRAAVYALGSDREEVILWEVVFVDEVSVAFGRGHALSIAGFDKA